MGNGSRFGEARLDDSGTFSGEAIRAVILIVATERGPLHLRLRSTPCIEATAGMSQKPTRSGAEIKRARTTT